MSIGEAGCKNTVFYMRGIEVKAWTVYEGLKITIHAEGG